MKTVNVFKRVVLLALVATMSMTTVLAQEKGDKAVGGNLVLGSGDSYSNYGIGAKFQYNVTTPIRLEGSFTYFLKKDLISMWDLSVNAHYLFPIADKLTVYPLAGLGILGTTVSVPDYGYGIGGGSASDSELGFNLGGGLDYQLTETLTGNVELKYKIHDNWDRLLLSVGIAYKF
jgi:outer membrane protein X